MSGTWEHFDIDPWSTTADSSPLANLPQTVQLFSSLMDRDISPSKRNHDRSSNVHSSHNSPSAQNTDVKKYSFLYRHSDDVIVEQQRAADLAESNERSNWISQMQRSILSHEKKSSAPSSRPSSSSVLQAHLNQQAVQKQQSSVPTANSNPAAAHAVSSDTQMPLSVLFQNRKVDFRSDSIAATAAPSVKVYANDLAAVPHRRVPSIDVFAHDRTFEDMVLTGGRSPIVAVEERPRSKSQMQRPRNVSSIAPSSQSQSQSQSQSHAPTVTFADTKGSPATSPKGPVLREASVSLGVDVCITAEDQKADQSKTRSGSGSVSTVSSPMFRSLSKKKKAQSDFPAAVKAARATSPSVHDASYVPGHSHGGSTNATDPHGRSQSRSAIDYDRITVQDRMESTKSIAAAIPVPSTNSTLTHKFLTLAGRPEFPDDSTSDEDGVIMQSFKPLTSFRARRKRLSNCDHHHAVAPKVAVLASNSYPLAEPLNDDSENDGIDVDHRTREKKNGMLRFPKLAADKPKHRASLGTSNAPSFADDCVRVVSNSPLRHSRPADATSLWQNSQHGADGRKRDRHRARGKSEDHSPEMGGMSPWQARESTASGLFLCFADDE